MIERAMPHDRLIAGIGLGSVTILSWVYLLAGAGMETSAMSDTLRGVNIPGMPMGWSTGLVALMFVMWWVMMVAMMLPSAAPMVLLYAYATRKSGNSWSTFLFASGYLLVWGGFSAVATFAQWELTRLGLLDGMRVNSLPLSGVLLLTAGVYQLTPAKAACLRHCRSPVQFLTRFWQPGATGALRMGMRHGVFCLGCCWALMALLFVGGVMSLAWIGALAAYVMVEKLAPPWRCLKGATASLLLAAGLVLLAIALT